MRRAPWCCGALIVLALGGAALGDEPRALTVNAQLLQALPADVAIAVEPRDDNDDNIKLRDLVVAHLTDRRTTVAADAPLLLRFSSRVTTNRDVADTGPTGGRGRRGGGVGGLAMGLAQGSGSGKGTAGPPAAGGVRHRLSATLERRDGSQVLWKVEVTTAPGEHDERTLPDRMAAALVDAIGKTVDTRPPPSDGTPPPPRR